MSRVNQLISELRSTQGRVDRLLQALMRPNLQRILESMIDDGIDVGLCEVIIANFIPSLLETNSNLEELYVSIERDPMSKINLIMEIFNLSMKLLRSQRINQNVMFYIWDHSINSMALIVAELFGEVHESHQQAISAFKLKPMYDRYFNIETLQELLTILEDLPPPPEEFIPEDITVTDSNFDDLPLPPPPAPNTGLVPPPPPPPAPSAAATAVAPPPPPPAPNAIAEARGKSEFNGDRDPLGEINKVKLKPVVRTEQDRLEPEQEPPLTLAEILRREINSRRPQIAGDDQELAAEAESESDSEWKADEPESEEEDSNANFKPN